MSQLLLYLDPESNLSLQSQIRSLLIDAILTRQIPVGVRLPSTRQLAKQLGVSRNTVISAVQELIAEGYLVSRERSGCYVNEEILNQQLEEPVARKSAKGFWNKRIVKGFESSRTIPSNWRAYPYLFLDGQVDKKLFPISEWRECARIVQAVQEIERWSEDSVDADDPSLLEEIRTKLLPPRGIHASADEILITLGAQNAIALAAQLLVTSGTRVGVESPGNRDAIKTFELYGAVLQRLPIDDEGICVAEISPNSEVVYTTPSHQYPTTITMSMARRRELLAKARELDFVIIEDDYEQEANFQTSNSPALKSLDSDDRVIYVGSLSKNLAPGLRLGYLVASAELIRHARELRKLLYRHPPNNNQRTAALFLSLGHYDALSRRLNQVHKQRWLELRQAVNYYFPQPHFTILPSNGGTSCWIQGPEGLNVFELVDRAQQNGILLEHPGNYLNGDESRDRFRLSVSAIDVEKIRPGLEQLAGLINDMLSGHRETLMNVGKAALTEIEIEEVMPGSALIGKTAYGDAYTVQIHAQGKIEIAYDNADQTRDAGRWWIEDGRWWRQFTRSTFGEARGFSVVLDGDVIKWFDIGGDLVDTELFIQDYASTLADNP